MLSHIVVYTERETERVYGTGNCSLISSSHSKYALGGVNFISQVHAVLSPQKAHKVIWSQFCSTRGGQGHNFPCDLRMEHFNNEMKATNAMGANKTPKAVQRISQASAGMEGTMVR